MADDEKRDRSVLSSVGEDCVVVSNSGKSINERKPLQADGVLCFCGQQSFFMGVAEDGKPCPYCGSLIVARCLGCNTWTCVGCVEKAAKVEREKLAVTLLADVGMQKLYS